jgi:cold shock CspA family protein
MHGSPMNGTVSEFSDAAGYGWITTDDGARVFFHCTQIADGGRTIAVGARVTFSTMPYLGRYEAAEIAPFSPESAG